MLKSSSIAVLHNEHLANGVGVGLDYLQDVGASALLHIGLLSDHILPGFFTCLLAVELHVELLKVDNLEGYLLVGFNIFGLEHPSKGPLSQILFDLVLAKHQLRFFLIDVLNQRYLDRLVFLEHLVQLDRWLYFGHVVYLSTILIKYLLKKKTIRLFEIFFFFLIY